MILSFLIHLMLVVSVPAAQTPADAAKTQQATASAFEKQWAEIQSRVDRAQWQRALKQLQQLVEAHEQAPYVLSKRQEILELTRRCVFWSTHEEPKLDKLVSGKLVRYSRSTGIIDIRYTRDQMDDFDSYVMHGSGQLIHFHPLTFDGPYSIEITGEKYPSISERVLKGDGLFLGSCTLLAGLRIGGPRGDQGFAAILGQQRINGRRRVTRLPAQLLRFDEMEQEIVHSKDPSPTRPFQPYKLKMAVTARAVTVYLDSKKILHAKKLDDIHGSLGFANLPMEADTRVTIRGKAHSAWIQGRLDEAMREERYQFDKRYKARDHLPRWLTVEHKAEEVALEEDPALFQLPASVTGEQESLLRGLYANLEAGEFAEGLDQLRGAASDALPGWTRHWLEAQFHLARDEIREAYEQCEKLTAQREDFLPAWRLSASLLARLESRERAVAELKLLLERWPREGLFYLDLAYYQLLQEDLPAARDTLDLALQRQVELEALGQLNRCLLLAERGPDWGGSHEERTRNYHIASNVNEKLCREAGEVLEEAHRAYARSLRPLPDGVQERRFRVFLFASESSYESYAREVFGAHPESTAGMYSPLLKQLLIWNLPDPDRLLETIRHEGFHQYMDRLCEDAPVWLDEGLAEYYEVAGTRFGRWEDGQTRPQHLRYLEQRREDWLPLERLLRLSHDGFYSEAPALHYAQSWAFVHFLRHGGEGPGERFEKLMDALCAGSTGTKAVESAFADADLEQLEQQFRHYIDGLMP